MKMNLRSRYVSSCIFVLGFWVALSVLYYWWLISGVDTETQDTYEVQGRAKFSPLTIRQSLKFLNTPETPVVSQPEAKNCSRSFEVPPGCPVKQIPELKGTMCETIHIVLVCIDKCIQVITPMLKSLLHHRQNPLHFHMIVNKASKVSASNLLDTWDLPDLKYTCYNAENWLSRVHWISNRHYSGIFGLVKLILTDILPTSLEQVILLDSDLTFVCDVAELWALFRNMTKQQAIGMVENESNWYTSNVSQQWPALGKGYNTGIMLLDLKKMRTNDWTTLWHQAVKEAAPTIEYTVLADQDIINAVIKSHPYLIYNISCQYNIQLSMRSVAKKCYGEDAGNIKIIHWNSPYKFNIDMEDAEFFKSIYQSYVNYDGNLLREKLHRCDQSNAIKVNYSNCIQLRAGQDTKLRTHLYYIDYSYATIDDFDVTLVLHLSMDQIYVLEKLVTYWDGPMSVAIYLNDREVPTFRSLIRDWSDSLKGRQNVMYHLVYKHYAVQYPVNYLRNVALEYSRTPYVFFIEVDLVPSSGLYNYLRSAIRRINPYTLRKCLVVPAFETQSYRASPPRDKAALLSRLVRRVANGDVEPFQARGHRPTDYTRWITAEQPYEVEWQSDFEPYLVVHRTVPKFDTRLSGFEWNKISRSIELSTKGYRPVVLPDAFVVHAPHEPVKDINTDFRAYPHYQLCLAVMKKEFMDDVKQKYNVTIAEPTELSTLPTILTAEIQI